MATQPKAMYIQPGVIYSHLLIDGYNDVEPCIHLGLDDLDVVKRSYIEGETSKEIYTWHSDEKMKRIESQRDALLDALAQQDETVQEQDVEDAIEAAYWHFDARKKGLNEWAYAPQSERDAFKAEARKLVRGYFPTRQAQDTKREMLAVADAFIRGKRAALAQQDEPCPNCASLEAQNTELDRRLAELERAESAQEPVDVGLLEYRGNSVAFIHQKMTAYRAGIDAAWDAFRANGLHPDGKTPLADMIAKYTAPPQRKPVVVSVDELANHIRVVDGNHSLGAGALAEKIVEFLIERGIGKEQAEPVQPVGEILPNWSTEKECIDGICAYLNDLGKNLPVGTKLHTHTPQRTMVPLTSDKDRQDQGSTFIDGYGYVDTRAVRAIEQAFWRENK